MFLILASPPPATPADAPEFNDALYLMTASLAAILLLVLFMVAVYFVLRIGRQLRKTEVGGNASEYHDAWSEYRLSDEQIAAATSEPPDAESPPPDDQPPRGKE
jgi:hypothetical protein